VGSETATWNFWVDAWHQSEYVAGLLYDCMVGYSSLQKTLLGKHLDLLELCPDFSCQPGDQLSLLSFLWSYLVPPIICL
jgi:hypothetical protein